MVRPMDDLDDDASLPPYVLAERLGVYREWVNRQTKALGISSEVRLYHGRLLPCYPIGTLTQLRARRVQLEERRSMPSLMTANPIAEALGRSDGWTRQTIKRLKIRASKRVVRQGQRTALYSQRTYFRLRG